MSAFSFDACHEWLAKARDRFSNCFIRQIDSNSLRRRFKSVTYLLSFPVAYRRICWSKTCVY